MVEVFTKRANNVKKIKICDAMIRFYRNSIQRNSIQLHKDGQNSLYKITVNLAE